MYERAIRAMNSTKSFPSRLSSDETSVLLQFSIPLMSEDFVGTGPGILRGQAPKGVLVLSGNAVIPCD